jgi:flagellar hook-associated protein 2
VGVTASFDAVTQKIALVSAATGSTAQVQVGETSGNLLAAFNLTAGTVTGQDAVRTDIGAAFASGSAHLDQAVTSGTFTLNGVIFNLDANTDTLQSVLVRINSSGAGVMANYDSANNTVSLTQKNCGSAQKIVLGDAGDTSNILYALKLSANNPPVGGAQDTTAGLDARVSVNGGPVQSVPGNSVDSLIPGVTLNLESLGTATVQVGPDVDAMVSTLSDFVKNYNDAMTYINTITRQQTVGSPDTADERVQGTFTSDRLFVDTKSDLTSIVSGFVSGLPNSLNQLAQIGITGSAVNYGKDAILDLDTTKLKAALTSDPAGVAAIFNSAGAGIAGKLTSEIKSMNDIVDGAITLEKKSLDQKITEGDARVTALEELLTQREQNLRLQFANMETMIAQLKAAGDKITALLGTS